MRMFLTDMVRHREGHVAGARNKAHLDLHFWRPAQLPEWASTWLGIAILVAGFAAFYVVLDAIVNGLFNLFASG